MAGWVHTIKTSLNPARIKTMVASVCRQPLSLDIEAHDLRATPPYRIIEARFSTQEDLERARLLFQRLGNEMMSQPTAMPRRAPETPPPANPQTAGTIAARPAAPAPAIKSETRQN